MILSKINPNIENIDNIIVLDNGNSCLYFPDRLIKGTVIKNQSTPWLIEPRGSYHIHKGSSAIPILSGINQIPRIYTHYFLTFILKLLYHLRLGRPRYIFPVGFPVKMLKELHTSIQTTCSSHLNLLDLITMILGERYKL